MAVLLGVVVGFVLGIKVGITLGHRAERRRLVGALEARLKGDGSYGEG
jgi:hypothetical protein